MGDGFKFIRYETAERIAVLTLNRPEVLNALHPPAQIESSQALDRFEADPDAWVLIITGAGHRAFCAGMDLLYQPQEGSPTAPPAGGFAGLTNPADRWLSKPVIAAVNGYALGGGFEIALACDIVVACQDATFGLPEVKRGIFAGAGGVHRLARQMPLKIAMGHLLTGESMTAAEAHRWGLVNEVVAFHELMPAARRWADKILQGAPLSIRATKEAAMLGLEMSLEEACNTPFPAVERMRGSADSREGRLAFAERRAPKWTGA